MIIQSFSFFAALWQTEAIHIEILWLRDRPEVDCAAVSDAEYFSLK